MNAVDTTGVEPLAHPTAVIDHVSLRLRPDVASEPNNREANQKSAPAVEHGLFLGMAAEAIVATETGVQIMYRS
jgi:aspartyl-tRNA(Asn)/glutamyl-tRNA(Gln) amidotransferase subunit C